jgi:phosphate ABC transporter permease protein PstC
MIFMKYAYVEAAAKAALFICALSAALILLFILLFLVKESFLFLSRGDILGFLTGTKWKPQNNVYGAGVFIVGSILTTLGALFFAVPMGLACAIFLSEVAPRKAANIVRPAIELLAGIPSVVYGLFALVVIVSFIQTDLGKLFFGEMLPTGKGILAASLILGVMILPVVISISQDAIVAVPRNFREGSYALGSTKWQTITRVVLPAALPGIAAGVILGVGRAIGETMAVVLVLGNVSMIPTNIIGLESRGETLTSAIMLEMSYASVGSMHYSALFAVGLTLFTMAFFLSITSEYIMSKRRAAR